MTTIKKYKKALVKYLVDEIVFNGNTVSAIYPAENIGNDKEKDKLFEALHQVALSLIHI